MPVPHGLPRPEQSRREVTHEENVAKLDQLE